MSQMTCCTALCALLVTTVSLGSQTMAVPGKGKVNMQGAIIESACAINTKSSYQTVDMSKHPITPMGGKGISIPFSINLVKCHLPESNSPQPKNHRFQITFDGHPDAGLFALSGEARGMALKITDDNGNIAVPGVHLPPIEIKNESMLLNYGLNLVSNQQPLRAGSFFSTIRFKMDYY